MIALFQCVRRYRPMVGIDHENMSCLRFSMGGLITGKIGGHFVKHRLGRDE